MLAFTMVCVYVSICVVERVLVFQTFVICNCVDAVTNKERNIPWCMKVTFTCVCDVHTHRGSTL